MSIDPIGAKSPAKNPFSGSLPGIRPERFPKKIDQALVDAAINPRPPSGLLSGDEYNRKLDVNNSQFISGHFVKESQNYAVIKQEFTKGTAERHSYVAQTNRAANVVRAYQLYSDRENEQSSISSYRPTLLKDL